METMFVASNEPPHGIEHNPIQPHDEHDLTAVISAPATASRAAARQSTRALRCRLRWRHAFSYVSCCCARCRSDCGGGGDRRCCPPICRGRPHPGRPRADRCRGAAIRATRATRSASANTATGRRCACRRQDGAVCSTRMPTRGRRPTSARSLRSDDDAVAVRGERDLHPRSAPAIRTCAAACPTSVAAASSASDGPRSPRGVKRTPRPPRRARSTPIRRIAARQARAELAADVRARSVRSRQALSGVAGPPRRRGRGRVVDGASA